MSEKFKIKMNSNRSFGLVFFVVFLVVALWSFDGDLNKIKRIPFSISLIFLILGIVNSKILTPLNRLWFKFGYFLGSIISPIMMGLVFFLVVTPTGLIMRFFKKDLLNKKYDEKKKTYWIKRDKIISKMKQQF